MSRRIAWFVTFVGIAALGSTWAADWPHWRGGDYSGAVKDSPPLVDAFDPGGPKKLWESEPLYPGAEDLGAGAVTVADGRAYAFVNARYVQPRPWKRMSKDFVFCFDAADGKTLWKKKLPSWHLGWSDSCSPTIIDGKCYVLSSEAFVYCLDAKTGAEIWKSEFVGKEGNKHNRSSSVLILDGVAVATTAQNAFGLDAKTGKTLWRQVRASGEYGSAVPWTSNGRTIAIILTKRDAYALDPKTGDVLWQVRGSEGATANIAGDLMVANAGQYGGVSLYRLALDKPQLLWNVKFDDLFTTPTICDGRVYIFGGAYENKNPSRAMCVEMSSGKVLWDEKAGTFEFSSGVLADGRILISGGATLYMIKPDPQKYSELARADLGLQKFATVTLVDGRLYARTKEKVVCYDLRK